MMRVAANALMKMAEKLRSTYLNRFELPIVLPLGRMSEVAVFRDYSRGFSWIKCVNFSSVNSKKRGKLKLFVTCYG